jgi:dTDP-4-amino-4,6-dideoxygalactose transaminase
MLTEVYQAAFKGHPRLSLPKPFQAKMPLIRFPLLANTPEEAEDLFARLRKQGFAVGKWYRPLLFPGPSSDDLSKIYGYEGGSAPVAESVAARIINLPTSPSVSLAKAKELIHAINRTSA